MKIVKLGAVAPVLATLAACSGGGSSSLDLPTLDVASGNTSLSATESQDQGTSTPVDDTRVNATGFAITEGDFNGEEVASETASIVDGLGTEITIDGQTYIVANGNSVSDDGSLTLLSGSLVSGDFSSVTSFELDGDTAVYVRGLATPTADLPSGTASYIGDAVLTRSGSTDVETGDFDMTADFASGSISGAIDVDGIDGAVTGDISNSALVGEITGDDLSDMALYGNFFGPNGEEFAGGASGQVSGEDAAIGLQAER